MSLIVADKWSHGGWAEWRCEGTALLARLLADAGDHDFVAKGCSFSALAGTAFELAGDASGGNFIKRLRHRRRIHHATTSGLPEGIAGGAESGARFGRVSGALQSGSQLDSPAENAGVADQRLRLLH